MQKNTQKHMGQRPLLSEYDDEVPEDRPKGMPSLAMIKTEVATYGLPASDAEHLYDTWLVNGFKNGRTQAIKSWKAAIRIWFRNGYFPSLQKKQKPKAGGEMTKDILDALAANPAYKKIDVRACAWDFKKWCEDNGHQHLVTSFIKFLNAKL